MDKETEYKLPQEQKGTRRINEGRTRISNRARESSYSRRAETGTIQIRKRERRCPKCGHKKVKVNTSMNSPIQGRTRCTRCRHIIKVK